MSIDVPDLYWTNESLLVTVQNGDGENHYSFDKPHVLLGIHPDCDLVLHGEGVENRSFVILLAPTEIYGIVLCASAKKAGRVLALEENRTFKVGRHEISVSRQANGRPLSIDSTDDETISVISWKTGKGRLHAQLPNRRPVVLGRRGPARVLVEDDTVSRVHCCLYRNGSELWAIDLCSSHGTWRKGKPVKVARLLHGNSLTAGETRFHFLNLHTAEVVSSLASAHREQLLSFEKEKATWGRHRVTLLSSLGQLHDGLDQRNLQAEEETELLLARIRELESQLVDQASRYETLVAQHHEVQREYEQTSQELETKLSVRIGELESQLTEQTNRYQTLIEQHDVLRHQHEQASQEFDAIRQEQDSWQSRLIQQQHDLDERDRILKSVEMDAAKRELELIAMKTKFRKEQEEFKLLRQKAFASREIRLAHESRANGSEDGGRINDETCISSPNFARILDEAIESHHPGREC